MHVDALVKNNNTTLSLSPALEFNPYTRTLDGRVHFQEFFHQTRNSIPHRQGKAKRNANISTPQTDCLHPRIINKTSTLGEARSSVSSFVEDRPSISSPQRFFSSSLIVNTAARFRYSPAFQPYAFICLSSYEYISSRKTPFSTSTQRLQSLSRRLGHPTTGLDTLDPVN